jgi:hypothetical protein
MGVIGLIKKNSIYIKYDGDATHSQKPTDINNLKLLPIVGDIKPATRVDQRVWIVGGAYVGYHGVITSFNM